jgi:hypothetical protein
MRFSAKIRQGASIIGAIGLSAAVVLAGGGCASSAGQGAMNVSTGEPGELRIAHHVGGTHYRALIHQGAWYQTFGDELLVLHPEDGVVEERIELGEPDDSAAAIDVLEHSGSLLVVLRDQAVVQVARDDQGRWRLVRRWQQEELGIAPRRLSLVAGEPYVSGVGGAVRLSTGERVFTDDGDVGRLVLNRLRPAVTVGRRVYRIEDREYLGSASELIPLPAKADIPAAYAFVRHGRETAEVGLMRETLREVDAERTTVQLDEPLRAVRCFAGRLWVVTDSAVHVYSHLADELRLVERIEIRGARDVALIDESHVAIVGMFGRAIYRRWNDEQGPGRTLTSIRREPAGLEHATFDGRHLRAAGPLGAWEYRIGGRVQPVDATIEGEPSRNAASTDIEATIADDGETVALRDRETGETRVHRESGLTMYCVVAVDGDIWIGHDVGITVLSGAQPEPGGVVARLRLDGPVRFIFPLLSGGGAAYVAERGGIGVARFREPLR